MPKKTRSTKPRLVKPVLKEKAVDGIVALLFQGAEGVRWELGAVRELARDMIVEAGQKPKEVAQDFEHNSDKSDMRLRSLQLVYSAANAILESYQPLTKREMELVALGRNFGFGKASYRYHAAIVERINRRNAELVRGKPQSKRETIRAAVAAEIAVGNRRGLEKDIFPLVAKNLGVESSSVRTYWFKHPAKERATLVREAKANLQKGD